MVLSSNAYLNGNAFSGSLEIQHLPKRLEVLNVSNNPLSDAIDVTSLPSSLKELSLHQNGFSGVTDFSKLPESLVTFNASCTNLSGTIRVAGWKDFQVRKSKIKLKKTG